jgi:hypothetical protein
MVIAIIAIIAIIKSEIMNTKIINSHRKYDYFYYYYYY